MNFPTRPGVFTASLTPLNPDSSPDLNQLVSHVKWLLGQGSDGVALLGSTGEANSLTMEQRLAIIQLALKELPPEKLMLVIGGEDKSVGQFILNMADHIIGIPQSGRVNSLNASVAAGIAMHALGGSTE